MYRELISGNHNKQSLRSDITRSPSERNPYRDCAALGSRVPVVPWDGDCVRGPHITVGRDHAAGVSKLLRPFEHTARAYEFRFLLVIRFAASSCRVAGGQVWCEISIRGRLLLLE